MTTTTTSRRDHTLTPLGTACPTWCTADHDVDDRHPGDRVDPLHRGATFALGAEEASERRWAWVGLIRDAGETRVYVCDDLELTLETAQQLVTLLPGLIAQARTEARS